jgi:hypothetical protein
LDSAPAETVHRIINIEIAGKAEVHVVDIPLKHGEYDGTEPLTPTP